MQGAAFLVSQIIPVVVDHQAYNRPFGQVCRLVENEPALLDAGS